MSKDLTTSQIATDIRERFEKCIHNDTIWNILKKTDNSKLVVYRKPRYRKPSTMNKSICNL